MATLGGETITASALNKDLRLYVPIFGFTIFLSALLLFCVQPMFSKMVLPLLGGSAAVWSVAMVVFQTLLLGGYAYAWLLTSTLPLKHAVVVHLAVLLLAAIFLPIALAHGFDQPPEHGVAFWVIGLFLSSVGLPCFAISANAPLLQAWFARTGHYQANNPYSLYRASNLGSFSVLLAYPFLIEPTWGLAQQSHFWAIGYGVLACGIAACGLLAVKAQPVEKNSRAIANASPIGWTTRLGWMGLAFIPSGLLVAVTAHIATDVASAPFLWVGPLAVFLLTFVLAFSDTPILPLRRLLAIQPIALGALMFLLVWGQAFNWVVVVAMHLIALFVMAMVCHTQLYLKRPETARLTEFYVWMSMGGVLGGAFAALLAPQIFNTVLEYPLLLVAAFAVRPDVRAVFRAAWIRELAITTGLAVIVIVPFFFLAKIGGDWQLKYYAAATIAVPIIVCFLGREPVRLLWIAAIVFSLNALFPPGQDVILRARSFYGVYKIVSAQNGQYHLLFHGTTMHGAEHVRDSQGDPVTGAPEPLAYYYRGGPYEQAVAAIRAQHGGEFGRVAAVGLGIGALSCYAKPGETWTYYELDPAVVGLAKNTKFFRTFSECGRNVALVSGDARLTLKKAKQGLDLLILDAFSSDSVPAHLLTKEAFALYKSKLSPHGVIALNISNRNLELAKVVAASATADGMNMREKFDFSSAVLKQPHRERAEIAIVTQSPDDMKKLALDSGWHAVVPGGERTWTDDYSNILGVLLEKFRGR
jgi:hypothetical protein